MYRHQQCLALMFSLFSLLSPVSLAANDTGHVIVSEPFYRICPLPQCKTCPTIKDLRAPGIGLTLETNHGAAVVRHHDGSYEHIALIEGDASYKALLRRLAIGPIDRIPDHIDPNWDQLQYVKSRTQRRLNKLLGRPATPQSAILGNMVSVLLNATRLSLGEEYPITAAVLSSPDRVRLTDQEIGDIFDYLQIRNLMAEPNSLEDIHATSAAYAGYGKGLCDTYIDADSCERQEWMMPFQRLLHIDLNPASLSATIESLQSVRDGSVDAMFVDFSLGCGHVDMKMDDISDSDVEPYWAAITSRIRKLVESFKPSITELLLTGTSATDPTFHDAIRDALFDRVPNEVLAVLDSYAEDTPSESDWKATLAFATARGAAEIAKRRQEGPVRCAQSDECQRRREDQQAILLPAQ